MANGTGGGAVPVQIDPPPPPTGARALSFALVAGAAIAGFAGFCKLAGILALLGLIFGLVDFFQNRRIIRVPLSALDEEGRLKAMKEREREASTA